MIAKDDALKQLALDLRWCWNHSADDLWQELDPELWSTTRNPWVVLQTISQEKLDCALADSNFSKKLDRLIEAQNQYLGQETWFGKNHGKELENVVYFSMEFMLSEALPIYSGGLGNVAGDQLKAASDLGVPVIGVGLLYSQGYFRQIIDKNGKQQAIFPYNDPGQLPIAPLRRANGEWIRIKIPLPGWPLWIRAWQVQVGRAKLYLLDTNDAANFPAHRGITSELYGGSSELRLKQELVLGIGGWRLLQELQIEPEVCHLNEGHAAFAILERVRCYMDKTGLPFDVAWDAMRPGNLFTTHTAVPAGFDRFASPLIRDYLENYAETKLRIPFEQLLRLGKEDEESDFFNMACLAIRGSGAVNGVSKLHGEISRRLFQPLFPRWPEEDVPVGYVTNGIHVPSWDSAYADDLWTKYCGKARWVDTTEELEKKISKIPDREIWEMRNKSRSALVAFARERLAMQLGGRGASPGELEQVSRILDPAVLTLGFARRFATYKRPNLLLRHPERLHRILANPKYPVQLVLAGKAHPADVEGQLLIQSWMRFIFENEEIRSRVIFLSDYDMMITEALVQGADLWINTPRRPWEACGTSGMKILVNGGLNLSELDGWWAEGYSPEVGWPLGDGLDRGDDYEWDANEANQLCDLLEQEIIPEFYNRNKDGIPVSWIGKIRESMSRLTPYYSANRSVRQYTEDYYIPGARQWKERTQKEGQIARQIGEWKQTIEQNWSSVRFGAIQVEGDLIEVELFLGKLPPEFVRVELFASGSPPFEQEMKIARKTPSSYWYQGTAANGGPIDRYTPRAAPYFPGVSIPLEMAQIQWQK